MSQPHDGRTISVGSATTSRRSARRCTTYLPQIRRSSSSAEADNGRRCLHICSTKWIQTSSSSISRCRKWTGSKPFRPWSGRRRGPGSLPIPRTRWEWDARHRDRSRRRSLPREGSRGRPADCGRERGRAGQGRNGLQTLIDLARRQWDQPADQGAAVGWTGAHELAPERLDAVDHPRQPAPRIVDMAPPTPSSTTSTTSSMSRPCPDADPRQRRVCVPDHVRQRLGDEEVDTLLMRSRASVCR